MCLSPLLTVTPLNYNKGIFKKSKPTTVKRKERGLSSYNKFRQIFWNLKVDGCTLPSEAERRKFLLRRVLKE